MKWKLALSLILTCAFCLQASARNNCDNDEDAPIARTASVPSVDLKSETPQPANVNAPSASDSGLDAADLEEIARIRSTIHEPLLNEAGKQLWEFAVEDLLKIAEGSKPLEKSVTNTLFDGVLLTKQELQKKALERAQHCAELIAKTFNEKVDADRDQGLISEEMRLAHEEYFSEIITSWPQTLQLYDLPPIP